MMQPTLAALELNIFQIKIKKIVGSKNTITNIYRIQAYDSIIYGYFVLDLLILS